MKNILKYAHGDETGFLTYEVVNGKIMTISHFKSKKVVFIEEHGKLDITHELKTTNYKTVEATLSTEPKLLEYVFQKLKATGNEYFQELKEDMCVITLEE
jgi:hypothetical protein